MQEAPEHPVKACQIHRGVPFVFQAEQGILSGRPKGAALLEALMVAVGGTPDTASGWGGDALSVYRDSGGRACLRWIIAMDTPRDRKELRAGLDQWAAGVGADISDVGDWFRIDRCA